MLDLVIVSVVFTVYFITPVATSCPKRERRTRVPFRIKPDRFARR